MATFTANAGRLLFMYNLSFEGVLHDVDVALAPNCALWIFSRLKSIGIVRWVCDAPVNFI